MDDWAMTTYDSGYPSAGEPDGQLFGRDSEAVIEASEQKAQTGGVVPPTHWTPEQLDRFVAGVQASKEAVLAILEKRKLKEMGLEKTHAVISRYASKSGSITRRVYGPYDELQAESVRRILIRASERAGTRDQLECSVSKLITFELAEFED